MFGQEAAFGHAVHGFRRGLSFLLGGQDPDGCDDYGKRLVKVIVDLGFAALQGSESPPPQSPSPSKSKSSGKGGKMVPEELLPFNLFERLFEFKGRGQRGVHQQLGRRGAVDHCGAQASSGELGLGGLVPS